MNECSHVPMHKPWLKSSHTSSHLRVAVTQRATKESKATKEYNFCNSWVMFKITPKHDKFFKKLVKIGIFSQRKPELVGGQTSKHHMAPWLNSLMGKMLITITSTAQIDHVKSRNYTKPRKILDNNIP